MIFLIILLGILSLFDVTYVFKSWVKPRIAQRFQFEPGRDDEVSWKEMWRRSAWRYDSWADRIVSIFGFALLTVAWAFVFSGVNL